MAPGCAVELVPRRRLQTEAQFLRAARVGPVLRRRPRRRRAGAYGVQGSYEFRRRASSAFSKAAHLCRRWQDLGDIGSCWQRATRQAASRYAGQLAARGAGFKAAAVARMEASRRAARMLQCFRASLLEMQFWLEMPQCH